MRIRITLFCLAALVSSRLEAAEPAALYTPAQALADALSGQLTYVGTGAWNGIFRINACLYRNQRVFVANVYCTTVEMSSFRIDVLSPERGRVEIYAEAKAPISRITRQDYFTFKAYTQDPPPAISPPLALNMKFKDLTAYDEKRYKLFLPGCWNIVSVIQPGKGCLPGFAHPEGWVEASDPFIADPGPDWQRLVKMLRGLAKKHGKFIDHPGG